MPGPGRGPERGAPRPAEAVSAAPSGHEKPFHARRGGGVQGRGIQSREAERARARGRDSLGTAERDISQRMDELRDTWQRMGEVRSVGTGIVTKQLESPTVTTVSRRKGRLQALTQLSGAHQALPELFEGLGVRKVEDIATLPAEKQADIANQLRPLLGQVYALRGGDGTAEFDLLSPQEILQESFDFAGTVAREHFFRDYLLRSSNEIDIRHDVKERSKVSEDQLDKKVGRWGFIRRVKDAFHARTKTRRELGRTKNLLQLKAGSSEWQQLYTAHEQRFAGEELPEVDKNFQKRRERELIMKAVGAELLGTTDLNSERFTQRLADKGVSREQFDNLMQGENSDDFYALMKKAFGDEVIEPYRGNKGIQDLAKTEQQLLETRKRLADVSQSTDMKEISGAFNDMRKLERKRTYLGRGYEVKNKIREAEYAADVASREGTGIGADFRKLRTKLWGELVDKSVVGTALRLKDYLVNTGHRADSVGYEVVKGLKGRVVQGVNSVGDRWERRWEMHEDDSTIYKNLFKPKYIATRFNWLARATRDDAAIESLMSEPLTKAKELVQQIINRDSAVAAARTVVLPGDGRTIEPTPEPASRPPAETRPGGGGAPGGGAEAGGPPRRDATPAGSATPERTTPGATTPAVEPASETGTRAAEATARREGFGIEDLNNRLELMNARILALRERLKKVSGTERDQLQRQIRLEETALYMLRHSADGTLTDTVGTFGTGIKIDGNELRLPDEYKKESPAGSNKLFSREELRAAQTEIERVVRSQNPGESQTTIDALVKRHIDRLHLLDPRGIIDEVRTTMGLPTKEGLENRENRERRYGEEALRLFFSQYEAVINAMPPGHERDVATQALADARDKRSKGASVQDALRFTYDEYLRPSTGATPTMERVKVEIGLPVFDSMLTVLDARISHELRRGPAPWKEIIDDPTELAAVKARLSATDYETLINNIKLRNILHTEGVFSPAIQGIPNDAKTRLINAEIESVELRTGTSRHLAATADQRRRATERVEGWKTLNAGVFLQAYETLDIRGQENKRKIEAGKSKSFDKAEEEPETIFRPTNEHERALLKVATEDLRKQIGRIVAEEDAAIRGRAPDKADRLQHLWGLIKDNPDFINTAEFAQLEVHEWLIPRLEAQLKDMKEHKGTHVRGLKTLEGYIAVLRPESGRAHSDITDVLSHLVTPENRKSVVETVVRFTGLNEVAANNLIDTMKDTTIAPDVMGRRLATILDAEPPSRSVAVLEGILKSSTTDTSRTEITQAVMNYVTESLAAGVADERIKAVLARILKYNPEALRDLGDIFHNPDFVDIGKGILVRNSENNAMATTHLVTRLEGEDPEVVNRIILEFINGHIDEARGLASVIFAGPERHRDQFLQKLIDVNVANAVPVVADVATRDENAARALARKIVEKNPANAETFINSLISTDMRLASEFAAELALQQPPIINAIVHDNPVHARAAIEAVARGLIRGRNIPPAHEEADLQKYIKDYLTNNPEKAIDFFREYSEPTRVGNLAPIEANIRWYTNRTPANRERFLFRSAQIDVAHGQGILNRITGAADKNAVMLDLLKEHSEAVGSVLEVNSRAAADRVLLATAMKDGVVDPHIREALLRTAVLGSTDASGRVITRGISRDRASIQEIVNTLAITPDGMKKAFADLVGENPAIAAEAYMLASESARPPAVRNAARDVLKRVTLRPEQMMELLTEVSGFGTSSVDPEILKSIVQEVIGREPSLLSKYLGRAIANGEIDESRRLIKQKEDDLELARHMVREKVDPEKQAEELKKEIDKLTTDLGGGAEISPELAEAIIKKAEENVRASGSVDRTRVIDVNSIKRKVNEKVGGRGEDVAEAGTLVANAYSRHREFAKLDMEAAQARLPDWRNLRNVRPSSRPEERDYEYAEEATERHEFVQRMEGLRRGNSMTVDLRVPATGATVEVGLPIFAWKDPYRRRTVGGEQDLLDSSSAWSDLSNDQRNAVREQMIGLLKEGRYKYGITDRLAGLSREERDRMAFEMAERILKETRFVSPEKAIALAQQRKLERDRVNKEREGL